MESGQTVDLGAIDPKVQAGVFVGRMNPMHLGHQQVIEGILETFGDNHLIFIGSCSNPPSIRHLFNYSDRVDFIRAVFPFPKLRIAAIPDFDRDETSWFRVLDDTLRLSGIDPDNALHVGGCQEDVEYFYRNNRNVSIVNRYSGPTVRVSGSEVRDALIERQVDHLKTVLDPRVYDLVLDRFPKRWNEMRLR